MKIITNDLNKMDAVPRGIGLGFFDGVHLGHRELIHTLVHECSRIGCRPTVYTFAEHPGAVLHQGAPFSDYISSLDDRLALLASAGVAETFLQHFDREYASLKAEDFLDMVLGEALGTRLVVVGPDYRFGRGAQGDVDLLRAWADRRGIEVHVVPEIELYGQKVSSTSIRKAVQDGDLPLAASLLGRPFSISGVVERGRGLGRTLGFPTANINLTDGFVCPAYGVYATRTTVDGRTYESVRNIGVRPTVDASMARPVIETFLYDANLSLYGREITVHFLERTRPELKFESVMEMSERIHQDLTEVREWHRDAEHPYTVLVDRRIRLNVLRTRRFAQSAAQVVFRLPMEARRNARIALLIRILSTGCRRFPDRKSLAFALDDLYGASIDEHTDRQGDVLSVFLTCDALMHWSDGTSPFRSALGLLFELLLEPVLDDQGRFDERMIQKERQNLIMEIRARENDRAQYAYDQGLALLCGDQAHGLQATGQAETVAAVTADDLMVAYRELLEEADLSIDLGGDIDPETLENCIELMRRLPAETNRMRLLPAQWPTPFRPAEAPLLKTERRDVEQARVLLFFDGLPPYCSLSHFTTLLFNSVLGGDAHSLLFETVREKMGLAYSVFSSPLRYLSALMTMAGVRPDQTEEAARAMTEQLARIADNQYDDRHFDSAVTMIEQMIRSRGDDLGTLLQHLALSRVTGRQLSIPDSLSLLRQVTRDQVAALAAGLSLKATYILTSDAETHDVETHDAEVHDVEAHDVETHDVEAHDAEAHDVETSEEEDALKGG